MKSKVYFLIVAGCLIAPQAMAQGKQDFQLVNRTGYDIDEVYVSASKSSDWEADVMGKDVLSDGETVEISFPSKEKTCKYDLKVVYSDKETAEWDGFNLCQINKIILRYDRKSGRTWAEDK